MSWPPARGRGRVRRQLTAACPLLVLVASGDSYDFALARYNPDGSRDAGFGSAGKALTDFTGNSSDAVFVLAAAAKGKLVAAGNAPAER